MIDLAKSDICYVDRAGRASLGKERREQERAACAAILSAATPPPDCGDAIPAAPARGPVQAYTPREMVQTENGNLVSRNAGYAGRRGVRVSDAFDLMTLNARKVWQREADKAERDGRTYPAFVPPFTHGQVQIANDYAALTERCNGSGVKCSSLEGLSAGVSGGDREAAIFRDLQRLRAFHARIGTGPAREVRRHRPSATGGADRRTIMIRTLVDDICLGGRTLQAVLSRHGWASKNKDVRQALHTALCAALDRMQGYDLDRPQHMG